MCINYKSILRRAVTIAWQEKIFWFFGFFASFLSLEGIYEFILSQINQTKNIEALQSSVLNLYTSQQLMAQKLIFFLNLLPGNLNTYAAAVVLCLLIIIFVYLAFVSQIYIIKGVYLKYKNKKEDRVKLFSESMSKFWPVVGVSILTKLVLYGGFVAFSLPLFYSLVVKNQTDIIWSEIFFFIFFIIFAAIIEFLSAYATNYIVLKNQHILSAIKDGWLLFSRNIIISLEIAFILFLLKIISIVVIFSLFFLFLIPLAAILFASIVYLGPLEFVIVLTLLTLIFTLISVLINSIFTAFYLASWTITFIRLSEETLFGKIISLIKRMPEAIKKKSARNHTRQTKK